MSNVVDSEPFFDPRSISGCQLWLDAADRTRMTISGTSVTSVTEKAQNITLTTQGTSSLLTLSNRINGLQTLFFNNAAGNSVYLQGTLANLLTGSFFVVWQAATQLSTDFRAFYAWQSQGGLNFPVFGYINSAANRVAPYTTFVGGGTPFTNVSVGTNYITFYSWTSVGAVTNVGFDGATPTAGTQSAYSSSSSVFTIMGELGASLGTATGYIGEMIFYNSILSATQRQQVEGYLAWKWGLQGSLPATHPYKTSPIAPLLNPPTTFPDIEESDFFNPSSLTGLTLWLDASDFSRITFTGSNITNVADKSPANITLSNATGFQYRRTAFNNGYPSFFSDAPGLPGGTSGNRLGRNASLALTTPFVFFIVAQQTVPLTGNLPYGYLADSVGGVSRCFLYRADASASLGTANSSVFYANPSIGTFGWIAGTGTAYNIANGSNLTANTATLGAFTTDGVTIGNRFSLDEAWPGHICEFLIYTQNMSLANRQQVEGYLAWKWGIQSQLPSYHPYKTSVLGPLLNPPITPAQIISATWTPRTITGNVLQLWLDANDPNGNGTSLAIGTPITSWVDKSGNSRTLTTTTAGTGSVRFTSYKGINAILFNSAGVNTAYMRVVSAVNLTNLTYFAVSRSQTAVGNQNSLLAVPASGFEYSSTDAFGHFIDVGSDRFYGSGTPNNNRVDNANASAGDAYPLCMMSFTNTSAGFLSSWKNGNTGTTNALGTARTSTATGFGIGFDINMPSGSPANLICVSQFSEFIVYNSVLSELQRQQVEGYLAWKWRLVSQLPASHPFKFWPPPP